MTPILISFAAEAPAGMISPMTSTILIKKNPHLSIALIVFPPFLSIGFRYKKSSQKKVKTLEFQG
jgi:hypothetical protein